MGYKLQGFLLTNILFAHEQVSGRVWSLFVINPLLQSLGFAKEIGPYKEVSMLTNPGQEIYMGVNTDMVHAEPQSQLCSSTAKQEEARGVT